MKLHCHSALLSSLAHNLGGALTQVPDDMLRRLVRWRPYDLNEFTEKVHRLRYNLQILQDGLGAWYDDDISQYDQKSRYLRTHAPPG